LTLLKGDHPAMMRIGFVRPALGAALACLLVSASPVALAQDQAPGSGQGYSESLANRLDRMDKQLREVRQIVLQAHATGAPVEIKEAGPDPQVLSLAGRLDDMEQTLRGVTGQIEQLQHDVMVARKSADADQAAVAALSDRIAKLEAAAAAAAPQAGPVVGGPGTGGTLGGQMAGGDQGAPPPQAAPADPKQAFAAANQLLLSGDYRSAEAAFQDYVDRFGDTKKAPAANYYLGETRFIQDNYAGAAQAYVRAIRGWPETDWAGDATVKLATSLVYMNRMKDACGALGEFDKRYPKASSVVKAHAATARRKAACQ
jgi:tol-pal system protein YbgF